MANQFLEQQLEIMETSPDDESLEDYIEEEEVETMPMSTVYSNKLIDLGLSIESEAQKKDDELQSRQGSSQDGCPNLEDVKAGLNYLQALSDSRSKAEFEANAELFDDDDPDSCDLGKGRLSSNKSDDKTQTVMVFSQNSPQRRDSQGSSELPTYVKKMMEKDASLRRLLKTGSVTISQINQPTRFNNSLSNITITKGATGGLNSSQSDSNGGGPRHPNNSSQPGPSTSVIFSKPDLDWSGYPAAQKFLELLKAVEAEQTDPLGPSTLLPPIALPVKVADTLPNPIAAAPVYKVQLDNFSAPRKSVPSRAPVSKPVQRSSTSNIKQSLPNPLTNPLRTPGQPRRFVSASTFSAPPKVMPVKVQPVKVQKPRANASRAVPPPKQQPRVEEEIDPTRFLEVSLLEEDHNAVVSDEHRRKYKCPHCPKAFCWSTDLKRHILTHTGERPFKCIFCSANFTRKFLMQKHVRKYHPDMDYEHIMTPSGNSAVSNGKKANSGASTAGTNGFFNIPSSVNSELITAEAEEDYDENAPDPLEGGYKFNHRQGITFKEEMYDDDENLEDDDGSVDESGLGNMFTSSTVFPDEDEDEDEDESDGRVICKEEMLDDVEVEEEDEDYDDFPEPEQFFHEEIEEDDNLHEDEDEEEQLQTQHHLLQQKYSLGKQLTNTTTNNLNNSSRSSSPIVINVFSSNTPGVVGVEEGAEGGFDTVASAASAATAPRRLSQSLVTQLARASAKLKGEMAKTTSAREALRLLVRR